MDRFQDGTCISYGNAEAAGAQTREWITGLFIPGEAGLRSAPVEIKWSARKKGWVRGWSGPSTGTSITLLVDGMMELTFRGSGEGTVQLTQPGDYVIWCPGTEHDCLALADCTVITIRWGAVT